MKKEHYSVLGVAGVLMILAAACPVFAQNVPAERQGNVEAGFFTGLSYGFESWRVMGGGNLGWAVTRYVMPYGEFSYFPGIRQQSTVGGTTYKYTVPLADFHGGVHLRMRPKEKSVVPYLVLGAGAVRGMKHKELRSSTFGQTTVSNWVDNPGATSFAANFGGGLRFYLSERSGVRLEGKVYKPSGTYSDTFGKVEIGFFYLLR